MFYNFSTILSQFSVVFCHWLTGFLHYLRCSLSSPLQVAIESIENIRTVASLTREDMFYKKFLQELETPYRDALKKAHVIGISFSFSQGVIFFTYAASFWLGAYLIEEGKLNFVDVFK